VSSSKCLVTDFHKLQHKDDRYCFRHTKLRLPQGAESKTEFFVQAAEFYIQRDGLLVLEEDQQVRLAISKLGLSSLKPFIPK